MAVFTDQLALRVIPLNSVWIISSVWVKQCPMPIGYFAFDRRLSSLAVCTSSPVDDWFGVCHGALARATLTHWYVFVFLSLNSTSISNRYTHSLSSHGLLADQAHSIRCTIQPCKKSFFCMYSRVLLPIIQKTVVWLEKKSSSSFVHINPVPGSSTSRLAKWNRKLEQINTRKTAVTNERTAIRQFF